VAGKVKNTQQNPIEREEQGCYEVIRRND